MKDERYRQHKGHKNVRCQQRDSYGRYPRTHPPLPLEFSDGLSPDDLQCIDCYGYFSEWCPSCMPPDAHMWWCEDPTCEGMCQADYCSCAEYSCLGGCHVSELVNQPPKPLTHKLGKEK